MSCIQKPFFCLSPVVACLLLRCLIITVPTHAQDIQPLRVDVSADFRRNDTSASHWLEWQVPNGRAAKQQFEGITVTLHQGDSPATGLEGQWFKKALVVGNR